MSQTHSIIINSVWEWEDSLFPEYYSVISQYIFFRVGRNRDLADDLTQDVFRLAVQREENYDWKDALPLLKQIAKNKIIDYHRKNKTAMISASGLPMEIIEGRSLTEIESMDVEIQDAVIMALADLPLDYQCVLELKYIRDYSVDDIAREIGRSSKAVESLLSKARRKLREKLKYSQRENLNDAG